MLILGWRVLIPGMDSPVTPLAALRMTLSSNSRFVDDDLMPVVGGRIQDDLPVDQLPFLIVGPIVDEGVERLDCCAVVALQRFAHRG